MKNTNVYALELGNMDNFVHVIENKETKECIVIDPSWEADTIFSFLNEKNITLKAILLTHTHYDHINAIDDIMREVPSDIPIYVSSEDDVVNNIKYNLINVNDNQTINAASLNIRVISTPGHTKESVCYLVDNELFTGDTLFINGCGRCDFPSSNIQNYFSSIQKLKSLPNETIIRAGHDYGNIKKSTLGEQKLTNPFLIIDNLESFTKFRMELHQVYRNIPFQDSNKQEVLDILSR